MGLFSSIGEIFSNVTSGVGSFVNQAQKFSNALNPLVTLGNAVSGSISSLTDNKDTGNQNPFGGGGSALGTFQQPTPVPIETTIKTCDFINAIYKSDEQKKWITAKDNLVSKKLGV